MYLFIEGNAGRAGRFVAELGDDERLAEICAAGDVAVDPAAAEGQFGFIVLAGQPVVRPQVDGAEVNVRDAVVAHKIAALQGT